MQLAEPTKVVAYLANNSEDLDNNSYDNSTTLESVMGTAVKNGSTTWTVCLQNEQ